MQCTKLSGCEECLQPLVTPPFPPQNVHCVAAAVRQAARLTGVPGTANCSLQGRCPRSPHVCTRCRRRRRRRGRRARWWGCSVWCSRLPPHSRRRTPRTVNKMPPFFPASKLQTRPTVHSHSHTLCHTHARCSTVLCSQAHTVSVRCRVSAKPGQGTCRYPKSTLEILDCWKRLAPTYLTLERNEREYSYIGVRLRLPM